MHAVLARFGVDEPAAVARTEHGLLNRVWRVDAADGSRWVLKQYLDDAGHASSGAIAAQHATIAALAASGLPTVPPVAADDGRTLVLHRGRRYAVFPFVDGAPPGPLSPRAAAELGTLLGRTHAELRRIQPPVLDPGPHPGSWPTADPEQTRRTITALLGEARARAPRDPFDALAEQRLRERLVLLDAHAHRRPRGAPPAGWVHGDFHPLNLLYRGERVAAVLDWDRLGVKPVAEEAVRAATQFFCAPASGVLDLARVRAYSRAYRAASGHSPEHLGAAVHRVWWERLNDFWMLRWRYARRDDRASELFPAAAAQIVWWCEEYQQVLDAYVN
ncbi:phosphotransferase enzyme family protein [Streptacidiphilus jiangxiensis]|uniref:Predicted kinase, aminoglycoside phosphotransferase (APT) family n=1 Tax=Streptacidiphilus jiangxiensis TaxID=235985 RepID=A0A1H7JIX9_STRJI|nr:phosphotransferase [Streptacidiphilus jiangxiensis]SEK74553.1 Predicted kinase, aminoglycoside phosphotransferase (APT) family [Streptacidiphilus jiangxiensis]